MADSAAYPSVMSLDRAYMISHLGKLPRQQQLALSHRDETIAHAGIVLAGVEL